jgi:hypothetical protein
MKMKVQPTTICGTAKAMLRGKFTALSAYTKRRDLSNKQPKLLEKQE